MSLHLRAAPTSGCRPGKPWHVAALGAVVTAALLGVLARGPGPVADAAPLNQGKAGPIAAPELEGGTAWLNTAGPIRLADLKGRIVLIDFWTLCCINCIHVQPDLAKLEAKYPNEL